MVSRIIIFFFLFFLSHVNSLSQTAIVKGYVYDAENGEPLPRIAVILKGTLFGASTDENGFYTIRNVPVGQYAVEARSIAFLPAEEIIELREGQARLVVFQLTRLVINIREATISAKKDMYKERNVSSVHRLSSTTIDRIPSFMAKPDLAEYLQVVPGVVSTGDRGGQLYFRGGTPVQNLTLLDGMTVINPFHSIGFVSVFDTDLLQTVDVYTSGFGASYGGRVSSVMDIKTRTGNRNNYAGKASVSTFGYGILLEGPIRKMTKEDPSSTSIIVSQKRSFIDATQTLLAPYLDSIGIPFSYNDLFGKYTFRNNEGDQFDLSAFHFRDRANYTGVMQTNWQNTGARAKYVYSPRFSSSLWSSQLAYSDYRGDLQEEDFQPRKTHYSSFDVHMVNSHTSEIFDWKAGFGFTTFATSHEYLNLDSLMVRDDLYTMDADLFFDSKIRLKRWLIEPGLHLRLYSNYFNFFLEPRIRVKYTLTESVSLNLSGGLYSQELLSTMADEDVIKVFQGFKIGVSNVENLFFGEWESIRIQRAWHFASGIHWLPNEYFRMSTEVYIKDFTRLLNYNRYKIYPDKSAFSMNEQYYRKDYIFERGWAYGLDVLMDYNKDPWSFWLAYSLGYVVRQDEKITYNPHFDRRHNLNLLFGYKFGKDRKYDLKIRWNIGSGFPFTQTNGLYEDLTLMGQSMQQDVSANGSTGVWYGEVNGGRLPWYHRLDISVHREWDLKKSRSLKASIGLINAYNRANVFYFDRVEYERINQYPIMPGFGLIMDF